MVAGLSGVPGVFGLGGGVVGGDTVAGGLKSTDDNRPDKDEKLADLFSLATQGRTGDLGVGVTIRLAQDFSLLNDWMSAASLSVAMRPSKESSLFTPHGRSIAGQPKSYTLFL